MHASSIQISTLILHFWWWQCTLLFLLRYTTLYYLHIVCIKYSACFLWSWWSLINLTDFVFSSSISHARLISLLLYVTLLQYYQTTSSPSFPFFGSFILYFLFDAPSQKYFLPSTKLLEQIILCILFLVGLVLFACYIFRWQCSKKYALAALRKK